MTTRSTNGTARGPGPPGERSQAVREFLAKVLMPRCIVDVPLSVVTCATCGVTFAVPTLLRETRRMQGRGICCPNRHRWEPDITLDELVDDCVERAGESKTVRKLRIELGKALHRAEQAEARNTD